MPPAAKTSAIPALLATFIPFALFVLIIAFLASGAATHSRWPVASDFTKFYASAHLLAQVQDMYAAFHWIGMGHYRL